MRKIFQLRDIGRHDWERLLKLVQEKFAELPVKIIPNPHDKEIEMQGNPKITFETMKYDLGAGASKSFGENRTEFYRTFANPINSLSPSTEPPTRGINHNIHTEIITAGYRRCGPLPWQRVWKTCPGLGQNFRIFRIGQ